jgi:urease accessory protein
MTKASTTPESTRITAADFVTPPEFHAWKLANEGAGRIGGLRLELNSTPDGTRLGDCYQQVPLRVLPTFRFATEPSLLFLLNPTAGLMDGDGQFVHLTAHAGSRAVVAGQSATRIHPCSDGFSTQQWHVEVEPGAVLVVLPGPAIPFRGCRYYQRISIQLREGAGLVWGDLWLAGRYARGEVSERFQFETIVQDLTVKRGERLIFRDRFCWRGPWDADTAVWHFGDAPACGNLFVTGLASGGRKSPEETNVSDRPLASGDLRPPLAVDLRPPLAVFPTAAGDVCYRWCGQTEAVIRALVSLALRSAATIAGDEATWLDGVDLAPAHWFTPMSGVSAQPPPG